MVLGARINLLLTCVPLGAVAFWVSAPALVVFGVNALAIVPLSSLLTNATEGIALEAGEAVGAFLNISLGNIVELILFFVTLLNGHVRIVQASILGSILVNLLPSLGSALIAAQMTEGDCSLENTEIQMLACLLFVSVFVFMILVSILGRRSSSCTLLASSRLLNTYFLRQTSFNFTFSGAQHIKDMTLKTSRVSAILILIIYIAYFLHVMQANNQSQDNADDEENVEQPTPVTPPPLLCRETPPLRPGPRTIRFADEHQDSGNKSTAKPSSDLYSRHMFEIGPESVSDSLNWQDDEPRGRSLSGTNGSHSAYTAYQPLFPQNMRRHQSRSISAGSTCSRMSRLSRLSRASSAMSGRRSFARAGLANILNNDNHAAERNLELQDAELSGTVGAVLAFTTVLVLASILLAISARLLVGTLDAVSHRGGLSEAVIGLVILPLAGNMSNYLTVVSVAARDNLDLAVAVSAGSAIQIALCVAPLTVLAGWALNQPVTFALDIFELAMLLGAASLVNLLVLSDGRRTANRQAAGLKGGILCACFLVMG